MRRRQSRRQLPRLANAGLLILSAVGMTGCQVDIGGQTLPSPYYIYDDVQYFAPGPEFKLSREAAAMKEYKAQQELNSP